MSWKDRLQPAAVTTPDGKRYTYEYQSVEKTIRNKTAKFTFSDKQGAKVQNFGMGEVSIPLTLFFSGADYDLTADAFEESAGKAGTSVLEHPLYGVKNVVIEEIHRVDDVIARGNQATFTLTITETIRDDVPQSETTTKRSALSTIDDMGGTLGETFAADYEETSIASKAASRITGFVSSVSQTFDAIKKVSDDINTAAQEAEDYITENIDDLLGSASTMIQSINTLLRIHSRSTASVTARIAAYTETIKQTMMEITGTETDVYNRQEETQAVLDSCLLAVCESALYPTDDDYLKRSDATGIAETLIELFSDIQEYLDEQEDNSKDASLSYRFTVSDALLSGVKSVVSQTVGYLVQLSMSLKQERTLTTTRERTIIDLCYELYGGKVEDTLDFFIESNSLTGDELILVPKGKEIVYYV